MQRELEEHSRSQQEPAEDNRKRPVPRESETQISECASSEIYRSVHADQECSAQKLWNSDFTSSSGSK